MVSHKPTQHCVAVLLATYNGGKYLEAQLISLEGQQGICVHVYVRDDGSTDETYSILERHLDLKIDYKGSGTRLFASSSFLVLLGNPLLDEFSFFAFCDQDDIWHPSKLSEAVQFLSKNQGSILYCTKRTILSDKNIRLEKYPKDSTELSFESLVFENKCYGNTMVFKSTLRQKFLETETKDLEMPHDWLLGRMALAIAEVHFDNRSQIMYRIHSNNDTGKRSFAYFRRLRVSRISKADAFYLREYQALLTRIQPKNSIGEMTFSFLSDLRSESQSVTVLKSLDLRSNPFENLMFKLSLNFSWVPFFKSEKEFQD